MAQQRLLRIGDRVHFQIFGYDGEVIDYGVVVGYCNHPRQPQKSSRSHLIVEWDRDKARSIVTRRGFIADGSWCQGYKVLPVNP